MNKVVFIINKHAGNGRGNKIWEAWKVHISFPYDFHVTERQAHATELAKRCAESSKEPLLIVAVGGDGTVHEIISGVIGYDHVRVGVISAGSGNDFGRTFSVFKTVEQLHQYVESSFLLEQMDVGFLHDKQNEYPFINNAGYGFDAKVAYSSNHSKWKKRLNTYGLGKLTYILYLVKELFIFRRFSFSIQTGNTVENFQNVWFLSVCNQPFFGGGMKISPSSKPNDQLIEMTVVSNLARWKLLLVFGTVFMGKHTKFKEVRQFQAEHFTIKMNDQVYGHVDGEFSCITNVDQSYLFTVKPTAWNLAKQQEKRS
ncbi:diacylglycerol kinase family lipid kinase [Psychrobacillus sp.]|uniref:diacylglycerol/lipid kinase family protein n=1 Tax=Psychrobacillus sp. TaxID=1871623 RepID=UPI0028BF41E3|nr:diacylglycerol kinase family lipid kinase [Psychrobacillus sp.]